MKKLVFSTILGIFLINGLGLAVFISNFYILNNNIQKTFEVSKSLDVRAEFYQNIVKLIDDILFKKSLDKNYIEETSLILKDIKKSLNSCKNCHNDYIADKVSILNHGIELIGKEKQKIFSFIDDANAFASESFQKAKASMFLRTSELKSSLNVIKITFFWTIFLGLGVLILFTNYSLRKISNLENDIKSKEKVITDWALQWQDTFDSVKDMIILFDKEGRPKIFNTASSEFFKDTIFRDDFCENILGIKLECSISKIVEIKNRLFDLRTYSTTDSSGCIVILRDITEQKKAEERLKIAEKLTSLGIMAGGIAHEINNPLTSVIGFSELLLMNETDEKKKYYLNLISNSGQKIERIIKDLRIFKDLSELKTEDVDIEEFLKNIVEDFRKIAGNIMIIEDFSKAGVIKINRGLFEIAINNLIKNAIEAINDSHIGNIIKIKTLRENGFVKIEISDNGPGIPKDVLSHIFEPFYTTKDVGKGMGLGLAIVYHIIKRHNSEISVKSSIGEGSIFEIKIPC